MPDQRENSSQGDLDTHVRELGLRLVNPCHTPGSHVIRLRAGASCNAGGHTPLIYRPLSHDSTDASIRCVGHQSTVA